MQQQEFNHVPSVQQEGGFAAAIRHCQDFLRSQHLHYQLPRLQQAYQLLLILAMLLTPCISNTRLPTT